MRFALKVASEQKSLQAFLGFFGKAGQREVNRRNVISTFDDDGVVNGWVPVGFDITERKRSRSRYSCSERYWINPMMLSR
jgi:PAS domain-containing protein